MTLTGNAEAACAAFNIDPATIEDRYFGSKDRVVHEYKAGDVCQYQDLPIYYLVRETSSGDGNRLEWVVDEDAWEQIREAPRNAR